jgi:ribosomal protein S27AE
MATVVLLFAAVNLTEVMAADPPPENEPPVIPGDGPAASQDAVTNKNYELIVKQNATLMGKIDSLTAKLNTLSTKENVNNARLDVFEAIEYNTDSVKINLPIVFLIAGLFAFILFVFGAIETSRFAQEKLRRNKLKCPKCGNYAAKIDSEEGNIYSCVCGAYYGEMDFDAAETGVE